VIDAPAYGTRDNRHISHTITHSLYGQTSKTPQKGDRGKLDRAEAVKAQCGEKYGQRIPIEGKFGKVKTSTVSVMSGQSMRTLLSSRSTRSLLS